MTPDAPFPFKADDLLALLVASYPVDELKGYIQRGEDRQALMYLGKLELIDELIELRRQAEEEDESQD